MSVSATLAITAELLSALNTILQFARDNGVSSRKLLDEYLIARAEGREFTQADILEIKNRARATLERLNAATGG